MKKVIIIGASGMVGKGVLLECLDDPLVKETLVIGRSPIGLNGLKLKEIVLKDFTGLKSVQNQLIGYDACFYCMGVSVLGLNEKSYTHITYGITKIFADVLYELNPNMVFNYVSGAGTDSSERGKSMWARVKGKTENYILNKGFKDAYCFRPGMIIPERGIKSRTGWYNAIYVLMKPFFPLFKKAKNVTTTSRIGRAMINSLETEQRLKHLENLDINTLASK
ncbi:epimerase [Flagellimonas onchidii]|uniref:epimerase n=1 Tax=Flagellimonas onchidii TaxID=2562684 RepID=UPI0010A5C7BA|nr:epimerase [Allomuricauda onchidii]